MSVASKRARRVASPEAATELDTVICEFKGTKYIATYDGKLLESKQAIFPYAFYTTYAIAPCADLPKGAVAYRCMLSNCEKVTVEVDASITSNLKVHLNSSHFRPEHKALFERSGKVGIEDDRNSIEDYTLMVACSGLPYFPFTESTANLRFDLQRFKVRVCCPKTFRKYLFELTMRTSSQIFDSMRGCLGHLMSDATPSKIKNEYVDFVATFIDQNDQFRVANLGSKQVLGPLDTASYKKVMEVIADNWGARFASTQASLISGEINLDEKSIEEFLVVSSCSDMGPGAHGAFQQLVGIESHVPCMAHGANGINRDAFEESPIIWAFYQSLESALKAVSETQHHRELLKSLNIPVPPKGTKIRWNSRYRILGFYLQNAVALSAHYPEQFAGLDFESLSFLHAITTPLASFVEVAQTIGPCDAFVLPLKLLYALRILNNPTMLKFRVMDGNPRVIETRDLQINMLGHEVRAKWAEVDKVRKAIVRKVLRRFFDGDFPNLGAAYNISVEKSVRRWNILKNDYILAAFSCTPAPYGDFRFLLHFGIASKEELLSICDRAGATMARFQARLEEVIPVSDVDHGIATMDLPEAEDASELVGAAYQRTFGVFQNHPDIKNALNVLVKTAMKVDDRQAFAMAYFKVSSRSTVAGKLIRAVMSKMLTTVKCETNFGFVQSLLSSARLRMQTKTLTGYYMLNLNRSWVMRSSDSRDATERSSGNGQRRIDQMLRFNAGEGTVGESYPERAAKARQAAQQLQPQAASGVAAAVSVLDLVNEDDKVSTPQMNATRVTVAPGDDNDDDELGELPRTGSPGRLLRSLVLPSSASDVGLSSEPIFEEDSEDFQFSEPPHADVEAAIASSH